MNFVALAIDTLDGDPENLCGISLAVVEDGMVQGWRKWTIQPPGDDTYYDVELGMAVPSPRRPFREVWPEIAAFLESRFIAAHNAPLMIGTLRQAMADQGILEKPGFKCLCSMLLARQAWPDLPRYTLSSVTDKLKISLQEDGGPSRAMACARIVVEGCRALEFTSLAECKKNYYGGSQRARHTRRPNRCTTPRLALHRTVRNAGWGNWSAYIHDDPQQQARLLRSQMEDAKVSKIDYEVCSATIQRYRVTLRTCTCVDYQNRGLPCKHIYRLAGILGHIPALE